MRSIKATLRVGDVFPSFITILKHRWATVVGIVVGAFGMWDGSDVTVRFAIVTCLMAGAYLFIGVVRRQFQDPRVLAFEIGGVLVFGALALGALLVDRQLAHYLLAAAWFGHGVWDLAHHWADKVVPRWYAELCGLIDIGIAVGLLLAAR